MVSECQLECLQEHNGLSEILKTVMMKMKFIFADVNFFTEQLGQLLVSTQDDKQCDHVLLKYQGKCHQDRSDKDLGLLSKE